MFVPPEKKNEIKEFLKHTYNKKFYILKPMT